MPEPQTSSSAREPAASCGGGCCTRISNLSVSYGRAAIIENVNLHFHCGEFTVITGPNGAGKTTLLRAIAGETPFTGEIYFHRYGEDAGIGINPANTGINTHVNTDINTDTNANINTGTNIRPNTAAATANSARPPRIKPRIGYVPQKIAFDPAAPMTVEDLFALSLTSKPRWLFRDRAVRQTALGSLSAVDAAHLISRPLGRLSGGELQRVVLSLALSPRPDLLLLDEPASGIDAAGLNLFYALIRELRAKYDLSVVMVSHDLLRSARYADRLIFFNKTVVCAGTAGEVLKDGRAREFFGTAIAGERFADGGVRHHGEGQG